MSEREQLVGAKYLSPIGEVEFAGVKRTDESEIAIRIDYSMIWICAMMFQMDRACEYDVGIC